MAKPGLCDISPFFFLFQGLHLLWRASALREEVQRLETEALQKLQLAVAEMEAEGLYRLLRGAILQFSVSSAPPLPKRHHHAPTTTISKQPPQESEGVEPDTSAPLVGGLNWHWRLLLSCLPSFGGSHPHPHDTLLPECGGIKWVYTCQVEG